MNSFPFNSVKIACQNQWPSPTFCGLVPMPCRLLGASVSDGKFPRPQGRRG